MIRRLTAFAHATGHCVEYRTTSPLTLPLLATGVVLVGTGLACGSIVQAAIGGLCAVAALSR